MEDTLRDHRVQKQFDRYVSSLNPCFNGRYSQRIMNKFYVQETIGLNPCFNGRYSQSERGTMVHESIELS